MADKWYNSDVGRGLGIGLFLTGFGVAFYLPLSLLLNGEETPKSDIYHLPHTERKEVMVKEIEADTEKQRLETIESIVNQYGSEMNKEELHNYLESLNLLE